MVAKYFVVLSLAVAASAIPLVPVAKLAYAEPEVPANYEFQYSVKDGYTGDIKEQKEIRQGYAVQGSYSLVQPDGVLRVVDYTSDKENGFNAVVRYEGQPTSGPVAKVAYAPSPIAYSRSPITYASPVSQVTYAAPVAKITYAAPVAKVAYPAPLASIRFSSPVVSYQQ